MDANKKEKAEEKSDFKDPNENLANTILEQLKSAFNLFKQKTLTDISDELKMLWRYEEKNLPVYTLEAAIKWFKEIHPKTEGITAGLLRIQYDTGGIIEIHHFFLKENEPLLGGQLPYLLVKTLKLEQSLLDQLKQNNLIVFK